MGIPCPLGEGVGTEGQGGVGQENVSSIENFKYYISESTSSSQAGSGSGSGSGSGKGSPCPLQSAYQGANTSGNKETDKIFQWSHLGLNPNNINANSPINEINEYHIKLYKDLNEYMDIMKEQGLKRLAKKQEE